MQQQKRTSSRVDSQTISLFVTLAVLTGLFIVGLRWAFLTPSQQPAAIPGVESASK